MKKYFTTIILFILMAGSYAQTVRLTFDGQTTNGRPVDLAMVVIEDLTQQWSDTIFYPDTVYELHTNVGIEDFSIIQPITAPNPCPGSTSISFYSEKCATTILALYDIAGKLVTDCKHQAQPGQNSYLINMRSSQLYILKMTVDGKHTHSVKILNNTAGVENSIRPQGTTMKSAFSTNTDENHIYCMGDQMRFTGYFYKGTEVVVGNSIDMATAIEQSTTFTLTVDDSLLIPEYAAGSFTHGSFSLPYREACINHHINTDTTALVILLHGGSQRGTDNQVQVMTPAANNVLQYLVESGYNVTFLVPQCPTNRQWNESLSTQNPTMTRILKLWLEDYVSTHEINTSHIYLLGYSMGGGGTWRMMSDYPTFFAAAMPVAATANMVNANNFINTSVYAVAGENDQLMNVNTISSWVNQLQSLGCNIEFDILPGQDHEGTCNNAFTPDRLSWIFQQRLTPR